MEFNDLLERQGFDPKSTLVLRHRPFEPALNRALPWLAATRPDLFRAYQSCQSAALEKSMLTATHIASFIGRAPRQALFVGLDEIGASEPLTYEAFWALAEHKALQAWDFEGLTETEAKARPTILRFDLSPAPFYPEWQGRLVIGFPPPERSWWRRAHRNRFPVEAIHETSALTAAMPHWTEIDLAWSDLAVLPTPWRSTLAEWRGIYLIFDSADGKSYVGSAYGAENLLGRWRTYATTGHGGNHHLRTRLPQTFRFSILERLSPDMAPEDVIAKESSWKRRLHTAWPIGLNEN